MSLVFDDRSPLDPLVHSLRWVNEEPIFTVFGFVPRCLLVKVTGELDNDNEYTTWVEYRFRPEIIRRDAHVTLKKSPPLSAEVGNVG